MTEKIQDKDFEKYIKELFAQGVFEMQVQKPAAGTATKPDGAGTATKPDEAGFDASQEEDGRRTVLIPYMMNDAMEYYLRLTDCRVIGTFDKEEGSELAGEVIRENGRGGFFVRQTNGNMVSVWFTDAYFEKNNYQYHRIGHNWRRRKGEMHIRRLVNILCVLHDKYHYLSPDACSEKEKELVPLIEFRPLTQYSPINEPITKWYPETEAGAAAMLRLAETAGDAKYADLVRQYMNPELSKRKRERIFRMLSAMLTMEQHDAIFLLLSKKIEEASLQWEKRRYAPETEAQMDALRMEAERRCLDDGYMGGYPFFYKYREHKTLFFAEEHPFTVLESGDYHFQIIPIENQPSEK